MSATVACPQCQAGLRVNQDLSANQMVSCPHCKLKFVPPAPASAGAPGGSFLPWLLLAVVVGLGIGGVACPLGEYKVVIKAGLMPSLGPPGGKTVIPGGEKLPETIKGGAGAMPQAVAPPAKYGSPDSGLTYTVKSGEQTKDFDLE